MKGIVLDLTPVMDGVVASINGRTNGDQTTPSLALWAAADSKICIPYDKESVIYITKSPSSRG